MAKGQLAGALNDLRETRRLNATMIKDLRSTPHYETRGSLFKLDQAFELEIMQLAPSDPGLQNLGVETVFRPRKRMSSVLSIETGCADTVPFQSKPNTPF